jgi:hypothetical protein
MAKQRKMRSLKEVYLSVITTHSFCIGPYAYSIFPAVSNDTAVDNFLLAVSEKSLTFVVPLQVSSVYYFLRTEL